MSKEKFEVIYWVATFFILLVNVYVIATSARDAVQIGRRLNNEQEKDNAKRNLFLTLFALRGSPVHYDFVRGLNEIDVVFEDNPQVLTAWHTLYDSLHNPSQTNPEKNWELQRVELLSAMAVSLGYNKIRQTDMVRQYYPEGHGNQERGRYEFREAQLTYYRTQTEMALKVIDRMDAQDEAAAENPTPAP